MSLAEIKITVRRSMADISAAQWDACANPAGLEVRRCAADALYEGERHNPFLSHAFLHALEASGSVGTRAGWVPFHLAIEDEREKLVAVAPCYLKSHSQGEYVFDHAWADAYERAGGDYYPKLQVSV
ncbi:MAG: N-acetyltransferase, partial [Methylobacteriaceae bacterium]|nr:N-acetyltransferase [Methylobacteriaceae bacterium]